MISAPTNISQYTFFGCAGGMILWIWMSSASLSSSMSTSSMSSDTFPLKTRMLFFFTSSTAMTRGGLQATSPLHLLVHRLSDVIYRLRGDVGIETNKLRLRFPGSLRHPLLRGGGVQHRLQGDLVLAGVLGERFHRPRHNIG